MPLYQLMVWPQLECSVHMKPLWKWFLLVSRFLVALSTQIVSYSETSATLPAALNLPNQALRGGLSVAESWPCVLFPTWPTLGTATICPLPALQCLSSASSPYEEPQCDVAPLHLSRSGQWEQSKGDTFTWPSPPRMALKVSKRRCLHSILRQRQSLALYPLGMLLWQCWTYE